MKLSDRALSWGVAAAFFTVGGAALGFWWLQSTVIAPTCGDIADAQLRQATLEMQSRIPSLRVIEFGVGCDSGYQASAELEAADADRVRSEAIVAGCRVIEPDPEDLEFNDPGEAFTCKTARRDVILYLDPSTDPVAVELALS